MMLPLNTIEDKETEEVQTKPPEKGGETQETVGRRECPGSGPPTPNICPGSSKGGRALSSAREEPLDTTSCSRSHSSPACRMLKSVPGA